MIASPIIPIPSLSHVSLDELDKILRGMFNERLRRPLEAELQAALAHRLEQQWIIAGNGASPPPDDVIREIMRRYVNQTPHVVNEQKLVAHLHATFNSMHPRFFASHDELWASLRETSTYTPFCQPFFWIYDPMQEMLETQRRAVETLTDPVPPTPAG